MGGMGAHRIQLKLTLTLLLIQVLLCGCAHQYLLKLNNGDQIFAFSKPKPQGDNYLFTDEGGVKHMIPQNRVVKIKPVWLVPEEEKPLPSTKPTKPKHWYFLWLA